MTKDIHIYTTFTREERNKYMRKYPDAVVQCWRCKGEGKIPRSPLPMVHPANFYDCLECHGTGKTISLYALVRLMDEELEGKVERDA